MKQTALIFAVALVSLLPSRSEAQELIYGVTVFRDLITFNSNTPGTILTTTPITGLTQFESAIAIDFRPQTGQLFALGNEPGGIYRLYTINLATGVATQVGSDISATFGGTFFGFDFNPAVDLIRIVNDGDQNFRYNPNTGAQVMQDGTLAYAAGDPNVSADPNIVGSGYTNNVPNAASTTLFGIDSTLDILVGQNANPGTLTTVGSGLGFAFANSVGFDISGISGTAFATSSDFIGGAFTTQFYTIDLGTGAASLVGNVGSGLGLNGISAAPIPEPSTIAFALCGGAGLLVWAHRRRAV